MGDCDLLVALEHHFLFHGLGKFYFIIICYIRIIISFTIIINIIIVVVDIIIIIVNILEF